MSSHSNRSRALVATLVMVAPLFLAAIPTVSATVATPPCTFGAGAFCMATYNGPDSVMAGTGETTLGVDWNTGKIMMSAQSVPVLVSTNPPGGLQKTARISFDDSTTPPTVAWADATNLAAAGQHGANGYGNIDPMLWVDPATGRTIAGGDSGSCAAYYATTDDDGQTWRTLPPLGCTGAEDHPTLGSGPYHAGTSSTLPSPAGTYPHVFYFCQQENLAICVTSTDGAQTFGAPVSTGGHGCFTNPGLFGHLRVGPDGTAYLPWNNCAAADSGTWAGGAISADNGQTWTNFKVPIHGGSSDPSIAAGRGDVVAPTGRLYFFGTDGASAAASATGHPTVTTSDTGGATWTTPVDLSDGSTGKVTGDSIGVKAADFNDVIAGDDNRAAVAFFGTKDSGNPFAAGFAGTWHLYVGLTYDGGKHWQTYDVTPNDPTQAGWMCGLGVTCPTNGNGRNLYDFMDVTTDKAGRVVVGYADGCLPGDGCGPSYSQDSSNYAHSSQGSIARQYGGKGLFAAYDGASSTPTVTIQTPREGSSVPAGATTVAGHVSRTGAPPNTPPTASLAASPTSGAPPLLVNFSGTGSDIDGTIASWRYDFGDGQSQAGSGTVPATVPHTYAQAGTFLANLTVTDNQGAPGKASVTIVVSPFPLTDPTISGGITVYDGGSIAVGQNVGSNTAAATGDKDPVVLAGEPIGISSRFTAGPGISATTPCNVDIYDATGARLVHDGCAGKAENPTLGSGFDYSDSSSPDFMVPATWSGTYSIAVVLHLANGDHVVTDTTTHGLRTIHVVGASSPANLAGNGHLLRDAKGDAPSAATDLLWGDAAIVGRQLVVTALPAKLPTLAAASATSYAFLVNGETLAVRAQDGRATLVDPAQATLPQGSVTWTPNGLLVAKIDLAWLASIQKACPCSVAVQSLLGGVPADRMPDVGAIAVPQGSQKNPDVSDPPNDVNPLGAPFPALPLPSLDITEMWIDNETAKGFDVTMQVQDMSQQPPSVDVTDPTGGSLFTGSAGGMSFSYNAQFCLDNNPNPNNATGFCYSVSAINAVTGADFNGAVVQQNGKDNCGISGIVAGGNFNTAASTVTWHLVRSGFTVTSNGADVNACPPAGTIGQSGKGVTDGTHLSYLSGSTGITAGLLVTLTSALDTAGPSGVNTYTFGANAPALAASAAGPYSGTAGAAISIAAAISGGSQPYACIWSGAGASFANANACATSVTYAAAGTNTISLHVTDAGGRMANATATVTVTQAVVGERVEVYLDGASSPAAVVGVSTSGTSPSANWTTSVDLSSLSGAHALRARWVDSDGATTLSTASVNVTVTGAVPHAFVTIAQPADDPTGASPVAGTITVSGSAGHVGEPGGAGELVSLTLDGSATPFATLPVDTTQGTATWSTTLNTSALADGAHTLGATYTAANDSASASSRFASQNSAGISITAPQAGSTVHRPIQVTGTTRGVQGPAQPMSNGVITPSGKLATGTFASQAAGSAWIAKVRKAFAGDTGFLAAIPALDGTPTLNAFFSGAPPSDLHQSLVPAPWIVKAQTVTFQPAIQTFPGRLASTPQSSDSPPVPSATTGIGPGSHLLMTTTTYPGSESGCTANFVWQDPQGHLYLGAAGHCFLPIPATGSTGPEYYDSTGHGANGQPTTDPAWNYDLSGTTVQVCISACDFGGQTGFIITGTLANLGNVVFARQNGPGDDFGLVRIPDSLRGQVRLTVPVWNGPTGASEMQPDDVVGLYGNAAGLGEAFPTMARGGIAGGNDGNKWYGAVASFEGDSGSAMVTLGPDTGSGIHGQNAVGILTHLAVTCCSIPGVPSFVAGTTMARSESLLLNEAGIRITPLLEGQMLPNATTTPTAPQAVTATPGDGRIALTWSAPVSNGGSPVTGYNISYGTSPGGESAWVRVANVTSATLTGLSDGTTYYVVVKATNANGDGNASDEISATPAAAVTPPAAPTNLHATPGDTTVYLAWSAPANGGAPITSYTVSWGTKSGVYSSSMTVTATTATVTGLTDGTPYSFAVSAHNSQGDGPLSAEATATPQATSSGSMQVQVRLVQNGQSVQGFDWTTAGYDGSAFSYTFQGAAPGAYTVQARLVSNSSVIASTQTSFSADNQPPVATAATQGGATSANSGAQVPLQGTASDPDGDAMSYQWTQTAGPAGALANATTLTPTFTAPTVQVDQAVTLQLTATDAYGATGSASVSLTIHSTTSFGIDAVNGTSLDRAQPTSVTGVTSFAGHAHLAGASQPSRLPATPQIQNLRTQGLTLSATATAASPFTGAGAITYGWRFGDGTLASGPAATHTYQKPGAYVVTLTVTNAQGILSQTQLPVLMLSGSAPLGETYYMHMPWCNNTGANPQWMDRTPAAAPEGGNGCESFGTGMLASTNAWTSILPATLAYPSGSTALAHIKGYTATPNPAATMSAVLTTATGQVVGTGSATASSVNGATLGLSGCDEWDIALTTTASIPAGALLRLTVTTSAPTGEAVICYEGGASATRLEMTAASGSSGGGSGGSSAASAAITSPSEGTTIAPGTSSVPVKGTATFPSVEASLPLYLRRDGCGTSADNPHLSTQSATDAGDGCSFSAGVAAPAGVASFVELYNLEAAGLPITLSPTGHVTGKVNFGCQGPDPFSVRFDILASGTVIGTQSASGTCLNALGAASDAEVDLDMALDSQGTGHALNAFALRITILQQGPIHWTELDKPVSYVNAPILAPDTGTRVQFAADDATFATGAVPVTGTSSWSASWSLSGVAAGPHTLYARACDTAGCGSITSVDVIVQGVSAPVPSVQVQIVPAGVPPATANWTAATSFNQVTGNWSHTWNTTGLPNGGYDVYARLLSSGSEVARDSFQAQVSNHPQPLWTPIGPQSGAEGSALVFQVQATDANGDAVNYAMNGAPTNATLEPNTGVFTWTPSYTEAGNYNVTFLATATDGQQSAPLQVAIRIARVNVAPVFQPTGDRTGAEGTLLQFNVVATDPNGDPVTYSATGLPTGATLGTTNGTFQWTPTYRQAGAYSVTFTASDGSLNTTQTVNLTIAHVDPGVSLASVGNLTMMEGTTMSMQLQGNDPDGDALTYSATPMPPGASLNTTSGLFVMTVPYDHTHASPSYAVNFSVQDTSGNLASSLSTILVQDVDQAPIVAVSWSGPLYEGQPVALQLNASDPENDTLHYAASGLPQGATIDPASGAFAWTPSYQQAGTFNISFRVDDGVKTTAANASLFVNRVNVAPVLPAIPQVNGTEGAPLAIQLSATDANGDTLTYSATGMPKGAQIDASTGAFTWTPAWGQAGTYTVAFRVSDGSLAATQNATLLIAHSPRPPSVAPIANASILEATLLDVPVRASTPDATPIALAASGLPAGATFVDHGNGTGDLQWTPPPASHGAYPISISATSENFTVSQSFTLTVKFRANFTLSLLGPTTYHGSPGDVVQISAILTNLKPEADTFALNLAQTQSWGANAPATITLGPGQNQTITLRNVIPMNGALDVSTLTATSQGQAGAARSTTWTMDVPVLAKLSIDNTNPMVYQHLTGYARLTYLNGKPANGVAAKLTQTAQVASQITSSLSSTTDANGMWFWDFGNDAPARMAGEHTLVLSASLPGVTPTTATGLYNIG